jgi:hypothetical protein
MRSFSPVMFLQMTFPTDVGPRPVASAHDKGMFFVFHDIIVVSRITFTWRVICLL